MHNPIRRVERNLSETLSALRGILLQLVEFALFVSGLIYIISHMMK
jgi:hypothetical protein